VKTLEKKDPVCRRIGRPVSIIVLHAFLVATVATPVLLHPTPSQAGSKKTDKREIDARQAFAAGRYQEALDLYAALFADKVHPTYLRNIGRCYQNLKEPDKAINAFKDYLRQAKTVPASEKAEVEGYIAEMEAMKKEQEDEKERERAAAVKPVPPPALPPTPPVEEPRKDVRNQQLVTRPAEKSESTPVYKKGWFWGVVTVVVVGAVVGGLAAGGVFTSKSSIKCTAPTGCS
jgi:hypothetical protein